MPLGFKRLCDLQDNWDGEGAPKPSCEAVLRAADIVVARGYDAVECVDPDVMGGVAVYLRDGTWIAVMNSGETTEVASCR